MRTGAPCAARAFRLSLAAIAVAAAFGLQTSSNGELSWSPAHRQEAVRGEIGARCRPRDLIKAKKYSEALARAA